MFHCILSDLLAYVFCCQVGGEFFDTIIPMLNQSGRVAVCGQISSYNKSGPDLGRLIISRIHLKCH